MSDAAALWAEGMIRACVQGGLFVLVVFLVCRLAPGLPAGARYGLWWLACCKLLVALFCAAAIALPVLPGAPPAASVAPSLPVPAPPAAKAGVPAGDGPAAGAPSPLAAKLAPAGAPRRDPAPIFSAAPALRSPLGAAKRLGPGALFWVWLAGVGGLAALGLRSFFALRRLLRGARAATDAGLIAEAERLSKALGLRRRPQIVQSARVSTPFVAGAFRPVIVLPEALSGEEARLALAHELAHVRRGDLRHGLAPVLAQALFWFFPPAWLACRECAACREEACDAAALGVTGAPAARYGRLLLKMAAQKGHTPALGIRSGFFALRRRLRMIQRLAAPRRAAAAPVAAALFALCLLGVLPWRLVAGGGNSAAAAPAPRPIAPKATFYAITDLGTLGGGYSDAVALNDSGQIVGSATLEPRGRHGHAFLWDDGRMRDLGVLWRTTPRSLAVGINDRGQVVAASFASAKFPHAFLWSGEHRRYLRGSFPGFEFYRPAAINDSGQIAGHAQTGESDWGARKSRAFLWDDGRMRDLGTLGGKYSRALALNDAGEVVGKADLAADGDGARTHAFLWDDGRMRDLGVLPGGRNSLAAAVNDNGQVAGYSETTATTHAFLWEQGVMRDLGALPGDRWSEAQGISDSGQVVGCSYRGPDGVTGRAVLWEDGRVLDLNERLPAGSGWTLESARAINRRGQIVGQGWRNGQRRAFLLSPGTP